MLPCCGGVGHVDTMHVLYMLLFGCDTKNSLILIDLTFEICAYG